MVTHVYTDSRFCGWLWDDVVVGGGGEEGLYQGAIWRDSWC